MARLDRAYLVRILPSASHGGVEPYVFEGTSMTLGTAANCSVTLPDLHVAGRHAQITRDTEGGTLWVSALGDAPVFLNGRQLRGPRDASEGAVLRVGGVVFLIRMWTEAEAQAASLPPLPGPVNTCHPTVVDGLRRLQGRRHDGGTFWVIGEPGCGRSVVMDHLRALLEESSGRDWITGGPSLEAAAVVPEDADPARTVVLPSLRNRGEDLLVLMTAMNGGSLPRLSPELVEALLLYDWPGNIRELRLAMARAHDTRFGAASSERWDLPDFPDCSRFFDELTGAQDPITLQAPKRAFPRTEPEMRRLLDAHWWRIYPLAAATGHSRASVLGHIFALGIREPWRRH